MTTVRNANWIQTQISHNAVAYTCDEFKYVTIIETELKDGRIVWTATVAEVPVLNVTEDETGHRTSVNWFKKSDLFDAIQKRIDRLTGKENAEDKKYEAVEQSNGRFLVRRVAGAMMIFILIFTGCGTMQAGRDRAAFQFHAERVGMQEQHLQEYHYRLEDIKRRLEERERHIKQERTELSRQSCKYEPGSGHLCMESAMPFDYALYKIRKTRLHIERRKDAVEYFLDNPQELNRRIEFRNDILASFDDQTFHKWTKDCTSQTYPQRVVLR